MEVEEKEDASNNNKGRGRGGKKSGSTTNQSNTSRTELSHYTYQVGSAKQASDFITVNDYLVRYIKMNYEMGRDIGMALEDLSPFDFEAVRPRLRLTSMFWVTWCSLGNPKCVGYLPA